MTSTSAPLAAWRALGAGSDADPQRIAEGLATAHKQQVVHRDIKPANVFLLPGGGEGARVKVLDFGIAKIMKEGEAAGTKGTFASFTWLYAAPEQLDPRVGQTGLATDVYAFGLLITELLTGRPPMDAPDVNRHHARGDGYGAPPDAAHDGANVSDEIEAVLRRALAVNPAERILGASRCGPARCRRREEARRTRRTMHRAMPPPLRMRARSTRRTRAASCRGRSSRPPQIARRHISPSPVELRAPGGIHGERPPEDGFDLVADVWPPSCAASGGAPYPSPRA